MHKIDINRYRRRKFYYEICQHTYDIVVLNDNDQRDKIYTNVLFGNMHWERVIMHGICYQGNNKNFRIKIQ